MARNFLLPLDNMLPKLVETIRQHPIVAIHGGPGAGKTLGILPALIRSFSGDWRFYQVEPGAALVKIIADCMVEAHRTDLWYPGWPVGYITARDRRQEPRTRALILTERALVRIIRSDELFEPTVFIIDEARGDNATNVALLCILRQLVAIYGDAVRVVVLNTLMDVPTVTALLGETVVVELPDRRQVVSTESVPAHDALSVMPERIVQHALRLMHAGDFTETSATVVVRVPRDCVVYRMMRSIEQKLCEHGAAVSARAHGMITLRIKQERIDLVGVTNDVPERSVLEAGLHQNAGRRLRIALMTSAYVYGVPLFNVTDVFDTGLCKPFPTDSQRTLRSVSRDELARIAGCLGRQNPGVLHVYMRAGKELTSLPQRRMVPLTRCSPIKTALIMSSAGYDPETCLASAPFADAKLSSIRTACLWLRHMGLVREGGVITELGERVASVGCLPEVVCAYLRAGDRGVGREALLLSLMILVTGSPFIRPDRRTMFREISVNETVVRLVLSYCEVRRDTGTTWRAYYRRDVRQTTLEQVDLNRLPRWIRRLPDNQFCLQLRDPSFGAVLTDRGCYELCRLVRCWLARQTANDFIAALEAYRLFEEEYRRCLIPLVGADSESVRAGRRSLRAWCERWLLDYDRLMALHHEFVVSTNELVRRGFAPPTPTVAPVGDIAQNVVTVLAAVFPGIGTRKNDALYRLPTGEEIEIMWQSALHQHRVLPPQVFVAERIHVPASGEQRVLAGLSATYHVDDDVR